jgi:hypothetical protein
LEDKNGKAFSTMCMTTEELYVHNAFFSSIPLFA